MIDVFCFNFRWFLFITPSWRSYFKSPMFSRNVRAESSSRPNVAPESPCPLKSGSSQRPLRWLRWCRDKHFRVISYYVTPLHHHKHLWQNVLWNHSLRESWPFGPPGLLGTFDVFVWPGECKSRPFQWPWTLGWYAFCRDAGWSGTGSPRSRMDGFDCKEMDGRRWPCW